MATIFGYPIAILASQTLLGLINGVFYALMALGLSVIFGMLNIVNFAHGALFMAGAFAAWGLLAYLDIGFWAALVLSPLLVGAFGVFLERTVIQRTYKMDHIYGLLLTYGLAMVIQGLFKKLFGTAGMPYNVPELLQGAVNLGFMYMPIYRGSVVIIALVMCLITWLVIERTSIGATLRAATENGPLVQAFGVNVPLYSTVTYGAGVALAAFAGVLAAPIYSVHPNMGEGFMITVFAIVVIGGMGSIMGSVVASIALGLIEGLAKVVYPQGSTTVIFIAMILVLMFRPGGLARKGE